MIIDHHFAYPTAPSSPDAFFNGSPQPEPGLSESSSARLEALNALWPKWRITRTLSGTWWAWMSDAIQVKAADLRTLEQKIRQWHVEEDERLERELRAQLVRPYMLRDLPQTAPPAAQPNPARKPTRPPRSPSAQESVVSAAGGALHHHSPIGYVRQDEPDRASA